MFLLLSAALAAPAGYKVTVANQDGCELALGPTASDGVQPIHATCRWPEASLDRFKSVMGNWAAHATVFGVIVKSEVREPGARALVWQLQRSKGISDREVLLWMWHENVGGADRYAWTTAKERPLSPAEGNVAVARSDGYWQAKADPAGGIVVEHHLEYGPGGSVPGFLVHWFQTSGVQTNLAEVRAAVK